MAQGKSQLKFARNPCNRFRDNWYPRRTTDGRTTDEFWFHELCWHSQAELKTSEDVTSFEVSRNYHTFQIFDMSEIMACTQGLFSDKLPSGSEAAYQKTGRYDASTHDASTHSQPEFAQWMALQASLNKDRKSCNQQSCPLSMTYRTSFHAAFGSQSDMNEDKKEEKELFEKR